MNHYLFNLITILIVGFIPALVVTRKMHLIRGSKSPISFVAMFSLAWITGFAWFLYVPIVLLFGLLTKLHYATAYYWNHKDQNLYEQMKETPILTFDGDNNGSAIGAYIISGIAGLVFLCAVFVDDTGNPGQAVADYTRSIIASFGNWLTQL